MTDTTFGGGGGSAPPSMDQRQFAELISTVASALRQTTAPLSTDQQTVALQFRLLRNGLGRFSSASEKLDRALLRVDQVHAWGWSELVFRDPLPRDARSMVLVVDSDRVRTGLPGVQDGVRRHRPDGEPLTGVVTLVELLDQFDVPIAAGVPVQVQRPVVEGRLTDPEERAVITVSGDDPAEPRPRYAAKSRTRTQSES